MKLIKNFHIYSTGSNGAPRTNTPDANIPGAISQALNRQESGEVPDMKSMRATYLWRNRIFTITKNVSPRRAALDAIDAWVKQADPAHQEHYKNVARDIKACVNDSQKTELNINDPFITSLPPLPPTIKGLTLSCESLATAPDCLELAALERMDLSNCRNLTAPPDISRCVAMVELEISGCDRMTSLPNCTDLNKLKIIDIGGCPSAAGSLAMSGCTALRSLRISQCGNLDTPNCSGLPSLRTIRILQCESMATTPDVSGCTGIITFNTTHNPVTSLHESLFQLPQQCTVNIDASGLSDAVRNRLAATLNVSGYTGPTISYDMGTPRQIQARSLKDEISSWLEQRTDNINRDNAQTGIDLGSEQNAQKFSTFLGRLRETSEYKSSALNPDFQNRVCRLLDHLQKPGNESLRETCFAQAVNAVETCGDRIGLSFLDMETACIAHQAEIDAKNGEYNDRPADLANLGKGMYRLQELGKIAREKVATLNYVDQIEVHLGYLVQLSTEFDLPVQMQTMLYPRCSEIKETDVDVARERLNADERTGNNTGLVEYLSSWSPMDAYLEKNHPNEFAAIKTEIDQEVRKKQEEIYETMENLDSHSQEYKQHCDALMAEQNSLPATIAATTKGRFIRENFFDQQ